MDQTPAHRQIRMRRHVNPRHGQQLEPPRPKRFRLRPGVLTVNLTVTTRPTASPWALTVDLTVTARERHGHASTPRSTAKPLSLLSKKLAAVSFCRVSAQLRYFQVTCDAFQRCCDGLMMSRDGQGCPGQRDPPQALTEKLRRHSPDP